MKNQIKLSIIACALMFSSVGCSKFFTKSTTKSHAPAVQEQPQEVEELPVAEDEICDGGEWMVDVEPQDSILLDLEAVEIPQEDSADDHDSVVFSEEQSNSIALPEYKNMVVDDMSLMLSEMGDDEFHYPADTVSYVTSPYGWRHRRMHAGVDIKVQTGDNIYAAFDGVVRIAKYYSAYGYCVVIRHYNGLETLYGHSSKLLVEVNDEVKAGQVIALGGSTGRSTGSHLHFEVRVAGNYINPNLVIDTKNHSLQKKNLYITRRSNRIFASNNDSAEEREADIVEALSIRYHTVRSGDVLSRIAANNHTTVTTLCRLNNISSRSTLRIGQRLIVRDGIRPPTTKSKQQAAASAASTAKAASTTKSVAAPTSTSVYTVRSGDTLSAIAQRNHTTVSKICALNNITSRTTLQIGQKLKLSGSAVASTSSSSKIHVVKSGDTLSQIAQTHHTTVRTICRLNNITSRTTLQIGQKLRVG